MKIFKFLILLIITVLILSVASVAGTIRDHRRILSNLDDTPPSPSDTAPMATPFDTFEGGILSLEIDYDVQKTGDDIYVYILSNLPDNYELSAELSNVDAVKKELGFDNISASSLTSEQMTQLNEQSYTSRERSIVKDGVGTFFFQNPPQGQPLDLHVTSPIIASQPLSVRELLGEQGANFEGTHVVFLEEVNDKSITFFTSFIID
jgi:hypothetical protein